MTSCDADLLTEKLCSAKILVVGAGGIGCELLKNLVMVGLKNIDVIDLDTIDVSNLNRQFLFHKQHVGRSKAEVAAESIQQFRPGANVKCFHDSILNRDYDVNFFSQYAVVLNALDNRAARNHVNRLCLAADIPLVESGSAGYLGQVTVIKKGVTECYECTPKPPQKTYPGCTIRNTPSEAIHCIVWAKHLFNQLYGEADIDEDVSPDMEDPELQNGREEKREEVMENGYVGSDQNGDAKATTQRMSTRKWAFDKDYDPKILFQKLFCDDIEYLLSMGNLWKKRRAPIPLDWNNLPDENAGTSRSVEPKATIKDQQVWTPVECRDVFYSTAKQLRRRLLEKEKDDSVLFWDKDDDIIMDFTSSVANLRSFIFGIQLKSRFDIKSMAGNIIPAIATTNAIVAGMIVMEAFKILSGQTDKCKTVFIVRQANPRGKILVDQLPEPPNPKCYVCSEKAEVHVRLNITNFTVKQLRDHVLKESLNMVAPDVEIADGSGTIIISSEPGELDGLLPKHLNELRVSDGTRLICDDFMQKFEIRLIIIQSDEMTHQDFEILTDISELKVKDTGENVDDSVPKTKESRKRPAPAVEGPEQKKQKVTV